MYLGLHVGEVFFGNVGSRERLDFTVLGPAVNEASRIAACRSVDQPILLSAAFADVGERETSPPFGGTICVARRVTTTGAIHDRFGSVIPFVIAGLDTTL
jgi:class 3 adenylate cyclase